MKRIALRHTLQPRIGVRQQEQSIGFGFCPTLVIIGSGGSSEAVDELFGLPENVPQLVIGSDIEVCRALQDIVPSMDLSISAEVAAGFTAQTQTLVGKDTSIGESVEQGNGSDLEQFFGVVEPKDCQWMTTDEVCAALEQIMQTIDPELTASMAQSITQSITQA
jgi:hypothetical protein